MKKAIELKLSAEQIAKLVEMGQGDASMVLYLLAAPSITMSFDEAVKEVEEFPF